jgi:glycosyltransferase involved in cell wall biosynthesis
VNGVVCQPSPDDLAGAVNRLAADRGLAARMGEAGFERAQLVTWEGVIEKLVETA